MGALREIRLVQRADFVRMNKQARRFTTPGFVVQCAPTPETGPGEETGTFRTGFTATKTIGNAVTRNRAKRRLRALARDVLSTHAKPGHDYVLIARRDTPGLPFARMQSDLIKALGKLHDPNWRPAVGRPKGIARGITRGMKRR